MKKHLIAALLFALVLTPALSLTTQTAQAGFVLPPPTSPPFPGPAPAPPPTPTISAFSSSPNLIAPGQSSTLSWSISNMTSLTINPGAFTSTLTSGSWTVTPGVSTTYTLTATNANGNSTASTTVTVSTNPPNPTVGIQVANGSNCAGIGTLQTTSSGNSAAASGTSPANWEPYCGAIYLSGPGPFSMDFRLAIAVGDQSGGACTPGNFGGLFYTPWVSQGGGWGSWATAPNYDPDCYIISIQTQPLPAGKIQVTNVRVGLQMAEGNTSCYRNSPSQPGVPVFSYGTGTSSQTTAANSITPDCSRVYVGGTVVNTGSVMVTTNHPEFPFTIQPVPDAQGVSGSITGTSSSVTLSSGEQITYQGIKGGYKIVPTAEANYTLVLSSSATQAVVYQPAKPPVETGSALVRALKNFFIPNTEAAVNLVCDVDCPPPGGTPGGGGGGTPPPNGFSTCPAIDTCYLYVDSTHSGQVQFQVNYVPSNCTINVVGFKNNGATPVATGVGYTLTGGSSATYFPATSPNETHTVATQTFSPPTHINGDTFTFTAPTSATIAGAASVLTKITDASGNVYTTGTASQFCDPASDGGVITFNMYYQTTPVLKVQ